MDDLYLEHYGTKYHSGRYPYGSGENPYQHDLGFKGFVYEMKGKGFSEEEIAKSLGMSVVDLKIRSGYAKDMKKSGLTETQIAKNLGISTTELRAKESIASTEARIENVSRALELRSKGYSPTEIGRRMGVNESTVRGWLKDGALDKANALESTADVLRNGVDQKKYIDIGAGSERWMGISRTKLLNSVAILKEEGYTVHYLQVQQMGTDNKTSLMVLAPPGTEWKEVNDNKDKIELIGRNSQDGGKTYDEIKPPVSINSNRIQVIYGDQGGTEKDGLIELRRGVDDISLGNARYAQVRIAVDGTHYLKGMAVYSDDLPEGVDIRFNTHKRTGTPLMMPNKDDDQVFKPMKSDKENPFGASIKRDDELILAQRYYTDAKGNRKQSAINIVNEEGTWDTWSRTLASQFLSKQPTTLAKKQLDLYLSEKKDEYDEIMKLTNPTIRKKMLESFADDCDASASDLKAAALPRQRTQVILPVNSLKDNEIYAPNFKPGEEVILVRYPHAGPFEIPVLKVTDKNKDAQDMIGQGIDAVGINSKVAQQLSGADFDGDNVIVIPIRGQKVNARSPLPELESFDPHAEYPGYPGMKVMSAKTKAIEMGKVSNLITDMTIRGAPPEDIVKAVKHSMVVIDAEKHKLDYKRSFVENDIAYLKEKWQGKSNAGASTLISLAGSTERVPARKEGILIIDPKTGKERRQYIDPDTGKKLYEETGETIPVFKKTKDENGKTVKVKDENGKYIKIGEAPKTQEVSRMSLVDDAYSLSSGTLIESIYANHANQLKDLSNSARKEALATPKLEYSPSANKTYSDAVKSLNQKLDIALKNAPLERKAQTLANVEVSLKKQSNPELDNDYDALKKVKGQALTKARIVVGASKNRIDISDYEWKAIQSGAISDSKLQQILNNTDNDKIKKLATPRTSSNQISDTKVARIKAMALSGHTQAQIADALGISVSAVNNILKGG